MLLIIFFFVIFAFFFHSTANNNINKWKETKICWRTYGASREQGKVFFPDWRHHRCEKHINSYSHDVPSPINIVCHSENFRPIESFYWLVLVPISSYKCICRISWDFPSQNLYCFIDVVFHRFFFFPTFIECSGVCIKAREQQDRGCGGVLG